MDKSPEPPAERLVREIGELSDRVRRLRLTEPVRGKDEIHSLEKESLLKWTELRELRAGSINEDRPPPNLGGTKYD